MTVLVSLVQANGDRMIGEARYAAIPAIGTELMFLSREWERYAVVGVRQWPGFAADPIFPDQKDTDPRVTVYVRYNGELE